MNIKSKMRIDLANEEVARKFVTHNYWEKLERLNQGKLFQYENSESSAINIDQQKNIFDKLSLELQYKGVDRLVLYNKEDCLKLFPEYLKQHNSNIFAEIDKLISENKIDVVDEKISLHWATHPDYLKTFLIELMHTPKSGDTNKSTDGWYLDKNKKTTRYFFGVPRATDETINKLTRTRSLANKSHYFKEDEIESIEVFDVKKSKIDEYLLSIGLDKEKLRAIAKKIYINKEIPSDLVEMNNKLKSEYGCYFNCATKYAEAPVNFLISQDILRTLGDNLYISDSCIQNLITGERIA